MLMTQSPKFIILTAFVFLASILCVLGCNYNAVERCIPADVKSGIFRINGKPLYQRRLMCKTLYAMEQCFGIAAKGCRKSFRDDLFTYHYDPHVKYCPKTPVVVAPVVPGYGAYSTHVVQPVVQQVLPGAGHYVPVSATVVRPRPVIVRPVQPVVQQVIPGAGHYVPGSATVVRPRPVIVRPVPPLKPVVPAISGAGNYEVYSAPLVRPRPLVRPVRLLACVDIDTNCVGYKRKGMCSHLSRFKTYTHRNCRRTCNINNCRGGRMLTTHQCTQKERACYPTHLNLLQTNSYSWKRGFCRVLPTIEACMQPWNSACPHFPGQVRGWKTNMCNGSYGRG